MQLSDSSDSFTVSVLFGPASNKLYTKPLQETQAFILQKKKQTFIIQKDNSDSNTAACVCLCVCMHVLHVFMAVTRSPAGRVLGPAGRATTPATSEETSSSPLWRKPEFVERRRQRERNGP